MAASNGTLVLSGRDNENKDRTVNIDSYIPDATGTYLTFNPAGLAGSTSPSDLTSPISGFIIDYITVAAPTAVGFTVIINNAVQNGTALRHANLLTTLVTRQVIRIPVSKGDKINMLQF